MNIYVESKRLRITKAASCFVTPGGTSIHRIQSKTHKKKVESPSPTPDLKNPKIIKIGESLREKFFYERLPAAETAAVAILLSLSLFTS